MYYENVNVGNLTVVRKTSNGNWFIRLIFSTSLRKSSRNVFYSQIKRLFKFCHLILCFVNPYEQHSMNKYQNSQQKQ